jgi:hypothetical protein
MHGGRGVGVKSEGVGSAASAIGSVAFPFLELLMPFVVLWTLVWFLSQKLSRFRDHLVFLGNASAVLTFILLGSLLREAGFDDIFTPAIAALVCNGFMAVAVLTRSGRNAGK